MGIYRAPHCMVCKVADELELDDAKVVRWQNGEHLQNVWPEMTADQREILISGTHPKCWDKFMGPDPDVY